MSRSPRSRATLEAVRVLGLEIARARRLRRMTLIELAERVGVSETTARSIERGAPSVAIGAVFEAARIVGVDLFGEPDATALASLTRRGEERLALLPSRVRATTAKDDF